MVRAPCVPAVLLSGLLLAGCTGEPRPPDPDALAELGRRHMSGHPRDPAKAREMFELAAQKGSGAGLFYLGLLAYEGREGAPDIREACGLFAQSAARGNPGGLREHGECQLRGAGGVARDAGAAAGSFRQSIANGGVQAYESLARLYATGEGVPRDPAEAARLLQKRDSLRSGR